MAAVLATMTNEAGAMSDGEEPAVKSAADYLVLARECEVELDDDMLVAQAKVNATALLVRAGFPDAEAIVERMASAPAGDPVPLGEAFCRNAMDAAQSQF
ncbi:MAG TPA: hypothetical protein VMO81_12165 [Aestuariivirgaceae bacterium]|nr:hypothetical protein [Aestuariivirgaceae bacterium]